MNNRQANKVDILYPKQHPDLFLQNHLNSKDWLNLSICSPFHLQSKHHSFQIEDLHYQGIFLNVLLPVSSWEKRDDKGLKLDLNVPVHFAENPAGTGFSCRNHSTLLQALHLKLSPASSVKSSRCKAGGQDVYTPLSSVPLLQACVGLS